MKSGHAYRIFFTNERLQKLRNSQIRPGEATMYDRACLGLDEKEVKERLARGESHTIRLRIPEGKPLSRTYSEDTCSLTTSEAMTKF
ncbi:hypothetical protein PsorP6_008575 [Peronosclerospora sorghi]|uniref:Uncharacterized protein n=1 Tax=Peronosclerospora sorghi TaxID=230839 RepID=A0ACC0W7W0_9STRA|nr:hypothetical protein PsorP6_008575 [Peronosclerospora sorghi]